MKQSGLRVARRTPGWETKRADFQSQLPDLTVRLTGSLFALSLPQSSSTVRDPFHYSPGLKQGDGSSVVHAIIPTHWAIGHLEHQLALLPFTTPHRTAPHHTHTHTQSTPPLHLQMLTRPLLTFTCQAILINETSAHSKLQRQRKVAKQQQHRNSSGNLQSRRHVQHSCMQRSIMSSFQRRALLRPRRKPCILFPSQSRGTG